MRETCSGESLEKFDCGGCVCELCGAEFPSGARLKARWHPDHFDPKNRLRVVQCGSCGMRYLPQKFALPEETVGYASDAEFTRQWGHPGLMHRYEIERFRREFRRRRPAGTAASLKLLDFGCGAGGFLEEAAACGEGWTLVGMDKDARACEQVGARLGIETFSSLGEVRTRFGDGSFDIIYTAHTLEHIVDLHGTLRSLHALLKPDGLLVVTVPGYSWLSLLFERLYLRWVNPVLSFSLIQKGHLNYFTPRTLGRYLHRNGFGAAKEVPGIFGEEFLRRSPLRGAAWVRVLFRTQELLQKILRPFAGSFLITIYAGKTR